MGKDFKFYFAVATLLLALFVQCLFLGWQNGQTTDETYYAATGYVMVRHNNFSFVSEHPPLINQIGSLLLLFIQPNFDIHNLIFLPNSQTPDISRNGAAFLYHLGNNPQLLLFLERLPIILLAVLLGLALFLLSTKIFGGSAALITLALYAFDPNMIAHGSLFTSDLGLTAFYVFSLFYLERFFAGPTLKNAIIAGVFCGLTFVAKISGLVLFPVVLVLFLVFYLTDSKWKTVIAFSDRANISVGFLALFLLSQCLGQKQAMASLGAICLLVIFFCFKNSKVVQNFRAGKWLFHILLLAGSALSFFFSYKLKKKCGIQASIIFLLWNAIVAVFSFMLIRYWSKSSAIVNFVKTFFVIWLVAGLVIILDYTDWIFKIFRFAGFGHFTQPLGIVLAHSLGGHRTCIEGSFVTCDWRYFFGIGAVKIPILTLVSFVLGVILLVFSKKTILSKALILVPSALFLGAAIKNGINIGLRHVLPVYPFLILLAGGFWGVLIQKAKKMVRKICLGIFGVLFVLSTARILQGAPDYLSYVNEFVGSVERGSKLVADSNLNWGQDNVRLARFVIKQKIPSIKIKNETLNADIYDYYKLNWREAEAAELMTPAPGFYALGIGVYSQLQRKEASWFFEKRPIHLVGKTFYIFEVTGDESKLALNH